MNKTYRFIDMLPYSPRANINSYRLKLRILKVALFVLNHLKQALIEFYINQNLSAFDPHVGENLCQIRACYLLELAQSSQTDESLQSVYALLNQINADLVILQKEAGSVEDILKLPTHEIKRSYKNYISLFGMFNGLDININISSNHAFLFLSYWLSKYKMINNEENIVINYENLHKDMLVSKNMMRKIVHQYQKAMSSMSTQYVFSIVSQRHSKLLLDKLVLRDGELRLALPCFLVMKYLLQRMQYLLFPILLMIRDENNQNEIITLQYQAKDQGYERVVIESKKKQQSHCMVFYITTDYMLNSLEQIEKFAAAIDEFAVENLIMAHMAMHPQYSGHKSPFVTSNPYQYLFADIEVDLKQQAEGLNANFALYRMLANDLQQSELSSLKIRHITAGYTNLKSFYCQASQQKLALSA